MVRTLRALPAPGLANRDISPAYLGLWGGKFNTYRSSTASASSHCPRSALGDIISQPSVTPRRVERFVFGGDRAQVQWQSVVAALEGLLGRL
jgi:hypothetical protein